MAAEQSKFLGFWAIIRDDAHCKQNVIGHLVNGYGGALKEFHGRA